MKTVTIKIDDLQDIVNNHLAIIMGALITGKNTEEAKKRLLELHEYVMDLNKGVNDELKTKN